MDGEMRVTPGVVVEFCGEEFHPDPDAVFIIGRDGDLVVDDDNTFLHRHFLGISQADGLWWLENLGSSLSATVADADGTLQAWLAPGARLPLVFPRTVVWFTAGPTTYEFEVVTESAHYRRFPVALEPNGQETLGPLALSGEQKLLLVALCENLLLRRRTGAGAIPASAEVARRLGWPVTKFNRKLDAVCEKFSDAGVRGLRGGVAGAASSRKARLAEYAMASRLVGPEDLDLLP